MRIKTIALRPSATSLITSKLFIVFAVFVLVMAPIFLGLYSAARSHSDDRLAWLYLLASAAPAAGMLIAFLMLISRIWKRTRPALLIDDQRVTLPRTGVSFPLEQLAHLQLYSRPTEGTFLVVLPHHVSERVQRHPEAVAPYTVRFPDGSTPQPFELVELLRARVPGLSVDKLGSI